MQALVTTKKTRMSAGTPKRSRIPRLMYDLKPSGTGMSQSSKERRNTSGNFKKVAAISSVRKVMLKEEECH